MTSKELREIRAGVAKKVRELADRSNDPEHEWSAEDEQEWTRVNAEYDRYTEQIERVERVEEIERQQAERILQRNNGLGDRHNPESFSENSEEQRALAMQAWFRNQLGEDLSEEHEEACRAVGLNPRNRNLTFGLAGTRELRSLGERFRSTHPNLVRRDLSAVLGSSGGFTVPEGFVNTLEVNMLAFGGMLQVADILRTEQGNDLPWPTADDTSHKGEQLGESASIGSSVDPTFGSVIWKAYKFSSKLIKIPVELLEDSAFDMAGELGRMLGERLGRIQNEKYTTGTGAATPKGILNAATLGVTAASATAIAADELFDLEHSVDPAYRGDSAGYMFHDNILLALRKLKDGQGQYLFQSNLRQGAPDTFNGWPFTINQDMASAVATGNKTILFGQFSKYKVRQVRQVRMRRLVERYADNDQEGFVAFLRADGNLLDAGTAPIKYLQQA